MSVIGGKGTFYDPYIFDTTGYSNGMMSGMTAQPTTDNRYGNVYYRMKTIAGHKYKVTASFSNKNLRYHFGWYNSGNVNESYRGNDDVEEYFVTDSSGYILLQFGADVTGSTPSQFIFYCADQGALNEGNLAGIGSVDSPFLVRTAADLNAVRHNPYASYKQMADIDLAELGNWEPICWLQEHPSGSEAYFEGVYDGNNFAIRNMSVVYGDDVDRGYGGLFAGTGNATLKNIHLLDFVIDYNPDGWIGAGGLVGQAYGTKFENCHVSGQILATLDFVGGLVGYVDCWYLDDGVLDCTFDRCSADVIIPDSECYTGGIVGYTTGDKENLIINCIAKGKLGTIYASGGIVGYASYTRIENCYAECELLVELEEGESASDYLTGGLVGDAYESWDETDDPTVLAISSYYNSDISYPTVSQYGEAKTTEELMNKKTYVGWDLKTIFRINEEGKIVFRTKNDPPELEIIDDFDFSQTAVLTDRFGKVIPQVWDTESQMWIPITLNMVKFLLNEK